GPEVAPRNRVREVRLRIDLEDPLHVLCFRIETCRQVGLWRVMRTTDAEVDLLRRDPGALNVLEERLAQGQRFLVGPRLVHAYGLQSCVALVHGLKPRRPVELLGDPTGQDMVIELRLVLESLDDEEDRSQRERQRQEKKRLLRLVAVQVVVRQDDEEAG